MKIKNLQKLADALDVKKNPENDECSMQVSNSGCKRSHDQIEEDEQPDDSQSMFMSDNGKADSDNSIVLSPSILDTIVNFSDTDS